MPVLITGATGLVGRALTGRFLADGAQVRVFIRRDDANLRSAGAHVAIGEACDVEKLSSALTQVHTMVHLIGGKRGNVDYLNRESAECAVIAAKSADVKRILYLSVVGADPVARDRYLRSKGAAEELIKAAGAEYGIFRCAPIPRRVPLTTVVEALVRADERESFRSGVWDLQ